MFPLFINKRNTQRVTSGKPELFNLTCPVVLNTEFQPFLFKSCYRRKPDIFSPRRRLTNIQQEVYETNDSLKKKEGNHVNNRTTWGRKMMIFSFKSAVIKELIPIGCGEKFDSPVCVEIRAQSLRLLLLLFFFLVMQKSWKKECTWTHNVKKQPNTWNALDESLKQTFRKVVELHWTEITHWWSWRWCGGVGWLGGGLLCLI